MCGIAGIINSNLQSIPQLNSDLAVMNHLLRHRGPDDSGTWTRQNQSVGFAHQRLSIIDLRTGQQPMKTDSGLIIVFNGEIYNHQTLRKSLSDFNFRTTSDTEVILKAYEKWGDDCVSHLRGMFAFAIWDERNARLFCARDRFGIKPFYHMQLGDCFLFASEAKALVPFLDDININHEALKDYFTFQFYLDGKTLFQDIHELPPAHTLVIENGQISCSRYWQVQYNIDWNTNENDITDEINALIHDSVKTHLISDVPIGSYVSGGIDSSLVAAIAQKNNLPLHMGFHGKFEEDDQFNESRYAASVCESSQLELLQSNFSSDDFINNIEKIIYHLDYPVAGPGSFPQYMVSQSAAKHVKTVLGGQGGDEIFGGYARYLVAYFEQCIKAAIDDTLHNGNFVVTYESIIPNLTSLQEYKPLIKKFWSKGVFGHMDQRYFDLINRSGAIQDEINLSELAPDYSPYNAYLKTFCSNNVGKESYFDKMTHFDFKTLLPALLHIEDRVSMAHGLESRVPFLDHPLVERAATIPSNIKFKNGNMKHLLKNVSRNILPAEVVDRRDKMGFPVPLTAWINGSCREFVNDILGSQKALSRTLINNKSVLNHLEGESKYGRKIWAFLSLELWQRQFIDQYQNFKKLRQGEIL